MNRAEQHKHRILTEDLRITPIEAADEAAGEGLATIQATLARGNIINRNQRYYSATVLERAANTARDRINAGQFIGLMDHPDWWDGDKGKPERTVIRWNRLWMDGQDLKGEGLILDTSLGRDLDGLRRGRVHIGLSTNAYATAHYENADDVPAAWDGDKNDLIEVIDDLHLLTVDVVNDPSNVYAAISKEATARREAAAGGKDKNMNDTERAALQEQLATLTSERDALTERVTTLEAELVTERRDSIAREAIARAGHLPEALAEAVRLTARAAESDEAAREAVTALVTSAPASNGNNAVPRASEGTEQPKGDPLRETREALAVTDY